MGKAQEGNLISSIWGETGDEAGAEGGEISEISLWWSVAEVAGAEEGLCGSVMLICQELCNLSMNFGHRMFFVVMCVDS